MSSFKNSSNIYYFVISKLAQTYLAQELFGTGEKIGNGTSDQIIKYGKFDFFFFDFITP